MMDWLIRRIAQTAVTVTNPKIVLDPRLIRKIKNDPTILSDTDFVEKTLSRYPGLNYQTLKKLIDDAV